MSSELSQKIDDNFTFLISFNCNRKSMRNSYFAFFLRRLHSISLICTISGNLLYGERGRPTRAFVPKSVAEPSEKISTGLPSLDNHRDRPEVVELFADDTGEGGSDHGPRQRSLADPGRPQVDVLGTLVHLRVPFHRVVGHHLERYLYLCLYLYLYLYLYLLATTSSKSSQLVITLSPHHSRHLKMWESMQSRGSFVQATFAPNIIKEMFEDCWEAPSGRHSCLFFIGGTCCTMESQTLGLAGCWAKQGQVRNLFPVLTIFIILDFCFCFCQWPHLGTDGLSLLLKGSSRWPGPPGGVISIIIIVVVTIIIIKGAIVNSDETNYAKGDLVDEAHEVGVRPSSLRTFL